MNLVDARTDVYVLGAGLFEIVTGRPPYEGQSITDILRAISEHAPPRARSVNPLVPPALDAVCARAMEKEQELRYQTASELGQDIQRWLDGMAVVAYPEPLLRRWGRWLWGRRRIGLNSSRHLLSGLTETCHTINER